MVRDRVSGKPLHLPILGLIAAQSGFRTSPSASEVQGADTADIVAVYSAREPPPLSVAVESTEYLRTNGQGT